MNTSKLYVVAVVSNPVRFRSRYELFKQFRQRMEKAGVNLFIAEAAFGDRPFEMTTGQSNELQVRSYDELWLKENLINLAIARLPSDWEYVAWVDADVAFIRDDWAIETVHQLQHYQVVQMWQNAVDLGPAGEAMQVHNSFAWSYVTRQKFDASYYPYWHPGFAWAARREAIDNVGGLIDVPAILGAGDHHMALSLIGRGQQSVPKELHPDYGKLIQVWQDRAERHIKRDIGFVPGTLAHYFHGKKKDRRYAGRWGILIEHHYDPYTDVRKDAQGVIHLTDCNVGLRDGLREYFRARNEDSIDL